MVDSLENSRFRVWVLRGRIWVAGLWEGKSLIGIVMCCWVRLLWIVSVGIIVESFSPNGAVR